MHIDRLSAARQAFHRVQSLTIGQICNIISCMNCERHLFFLLHMPVHIAELDGPMAPAMSIGDLTEAPVRRSLLWRGTMVPVHAGG